MKKLHDYLVLKFNQFMTWVFKHPTPTTCIDCDEIVCDCWKIAMKKDNE